MSLLQLRHLASLSGRVAVATTTVTHGFPYPKPKHPQHLISLLLKDPSQRQPLQQVHSHIVISGLFHYPFHNVSTCLLLFNNVIRSYSLGPYPHEALHFFRYTQHCHTFLTYPSLDTFSFSFLFHASANPDCTHFGIQLHTLVFKLGFLFHVYVQTGLLQMYSTSGLLVEAAQVFYETPDRNLVTWNVFITGLIKWGLVDLAYSVFNKMPARSVVSWTLVIDGYTRMNQPMKALTLFREMIEVDGIEPTEVTLLTIFPTIANIGCIKICQSAHGYAEKRGFNAFDIRIANALIDLYAKCGCISSLSRFFQEIPDHRKNLVPREVANVVMWRTLLGACSVHNNVEIGQRVTRKILEMERGHGGDYVLMSNILVGVGRFKDAERLREMIDKRFVFKLPGHSLV
ncbi:hypothetical protein Fmac_013801 [Flemingia macrophylla]|uniref:Pentatricopeptide repeat-containing protein n=1 Tax=Flemingia macrophylla TaxID=520843 RepID=A0ABD1M9X8_9FABA